MQSVVACYATAPRVCTLVLFILSATVHDSPLTGLPLPVFDMPDPSFQAGSPELGIRADSKEQLPRTVSMLGEPHSKTKSRA